MKDNTMMAALIGALICVLLYPIVWWWAFVAVVVLAAWRLAVAEASHMLEVGDWFDSAGFVMGGFMACLMSWLLESVAMAWN